MTNTTSKRGKAPGSAANHYKKGRSGNPSGRPRKCPAPVPKTLQEAAPAIARQTVPVMQGGHREERMKAELLLQRLVDDGIREGGAAARHAVKLLLTTLPPASEPLVAPDHVDPVQAFIDSLDIDSIVTAAEAKLEDEMAKGANLHTLPQISPDDAEERSPEVDPIDEFYTGMIGWGPAASG